MGCGGCEVDIVITGTCAHHDFEVAGSVEHLGVNFVGADDESIHIGNSGQKIGLGCVLLEKYEFGTGTLDNFTHTVNRNGGKRFFGCYEYFHINAVSRNRS